MSLDYDRFLDQSTNPQTDTADSLRQVERVAALTVIIHPDISRIGESFLMQSKRPVSLCRSEPEFTPWGKALGHHLGHPSLSRTPIRLSLQDDGVLIQRGEHKGKVWVDGQPLDEERFLSSEALNRGVPLDLARRVLLFVHLCSPNKLMDLDQMGMVGYSDALMSVRAEIYRLAQLDVTVLIRGKTGTGKEMVAQALHQYGVRKNGPFVSVNMGGLSESLATAELFGATRGAFSGAEKARTGYIRAAHEGVLFLDEIGETQIPVQTMLLRVLETREVVPVGAHHGQPVDIRLISATDADLEGLVDQGSFREPLLHRIGACELHLPALTERLEDLGLLIVHFAQNICERLGLGALPQPQDPHAPPWLPTDLGTRLLQYSWPGNVRQCRNIVSDLVIASGNHRQLVATPRLARLLDKEMPKEPAAVVQTTPPKTKRKPSQISEEELAKTLEACDWIPRLAAKELGISRSSVYNLIAKSPNIHNVTDLSDGTLEQSFQECNGDLMKICHHLKVSLEGLKRVYTRMGLV